LTVSKLKKKINMVRTKQTARISTGGRPFGGLKKVPQEEIRKETSWMRLQPKLKTRALS
jgi:hypothetical protein